MLTRDEIGVLCLPKQEPYEDEAGHLAFYQAYFETFLLFLFSCICTDISDRIW